MANEKPQSLQNHTRLVPPFHMFVLPVLLVNVGGSIYHLVKIGIFYNSVFGVLMALALFMLAFYARTFAMTVQDRVIRLEMRLRLREVLPPELWSRINDLTPRQLVALRFASDAELPDLTRQVLAAKLTKGRDIKQQVKNWQADYFRA